MLSQKTQDLKALEPLLIAAYRKNLIGGFVDGDDITKHSNGSSIHESHEDAITVFDSWTNENPSMGYTQIIHRAPTPIHTGGIIWTMSYYDVCFPSSPYASRDQILNFLRAAIKAYDNSGLPFRGQNGFFQALPHPLTKATGAIYLRYEIKSANESLSSFGNFSIMEKVILDVRNKSLEEVFIWKAIGGYVNLAS